MYTLMHSYIVSDPYCLLYYGPLFFLLSMSVVGPLEKKIDLYTVCIRQDFAVHCHISSIAYLALWEKTESEGMCYYVKA